MEKGSQKTPSLVEKNKLYRAERGKKRAIVGKEDQDDIFLADLDSSAEKILKRTQRSMRAESEGASPLYRKLSFGPDNDSARLVLPFSLSLRSSSLLYDPALPT